MPKAAAWALRVRALAVYKELHGHVVVPYRYSVPKDDERWPRETWALPLGNVVHKLRQSHASLPADRRDALEALGFAFSGLKTTLTWSDKMVALSTYKRLCGHLRVPTAFVVPDNDSSWPRSLWCLKLGGIVQKLRKAGHTLDHAKRLDLVALGFVWSLKRKRAPSPPPAASPPVLIASNSVLPPPPPIVETYLPLPSYESPLVPLQRKRASATHSSISLQSQRLLVQLASLHYGHAMPSKFCVPATAPWPPEAHGRTIDVDVMRQAYKRGMLDPSVVAALNRVHFVWSVRQHHMETHLVALRTFHRLFEHTEVPYRFVVPTQNEPDASLWPSSVHGLHLGNVVHKWRQRQGRLTPAQRAQLDALGFVYDATRSPYIEWSDKVLALQTYKALAGHVRVPKSFVVPDKDLNWPPQLWGMKLGGVVDKLRRGLDGLTNDQRATLASLGFVGKHGRALASDEATSVVPI
ncbi:hypothetical protein SPRG_14020 [Saprolegnia parasitica CBS 223.65]|uniref:Helicase-associated domain-containing protein n=1 Tax=Saprolegnia parasitica (strain CBS 223.65) TaxID=695850 RepID=A0A067BQY0_SAPPC|nr:hypothetical protein SPRG_14020 [Saprolegnia parasitica CBS 223.65]KDO20929.1 hypothetical protein SPRG_14020 [Saprolegnia parasitica CBS 223.65]|eukprot:XP_012208321.1 hypothetical protein SPRG_14020 [Saprolegnia parasitica CBS 223.65]